jgi:NADH dehydrogenase FAD-containing subunit
MSVVRAGTTADGPVDAARQIVLVGAGHAHLYALRNAAAFARRGFGLVVIAPEDFWYSGLATGVLGGIYPPSLDRIDIAALIDGAGARLVRKSMIGLDRDGRRVLLDDGSTIAFGALSLNLGSAVPPIPGIDERHYAAKPVTRLIALRAALERSFRQQPDTRIAVAIAGGGVTGCEIAAAVAELARRHGAGVDIVVYAGDRLLPNLPPAGARRLARSLCRCGIDIRRGARVTAVEGEHVVLADGRPERFDYLVNATGLSPPPLAARIGLPTTDDGAIVVDDTLMAPGADGVFAAGDCIAFAGQALPRVGVYAIRQSPVLFHNLMAFVDDGDLQRFSPQPRYLSIMTLGAGKGFARRAGLWCQGRAAFRLKDWIDRRFLAAHRPQRQGTVEMARLASTDRSGG